MPGDYIPAVTDTPAAVDGRVKQRLGGWKLCPIRNVAATARLVAGFAVVQGAEVGIVEDLIRRADNAVLVAGRGKVGIVDARSLRKVVQQLIAGHVKASPPV